VVVKEDGIIWAT